MANVSHLGPLPFCVPEVESTSRPFGFTLDEIMALFWRAKATEMTLENTAEVTASAEPYSIEGGYWTSPPTWEWVPITAEVGEVNVSLGQAPTGPYSYYNDNRTSSTRVSLQDGPLQETDLVCGTVTYEGFNEYETKSQALPESEPSSSYSAEWVPLFTYDTLNRSLFYASQYRGSSKSNNQYEGNDAYPPTPRAFASNNARVAFQAGFILKLRNLVKVGDLYYPLLIDQSTFYPDPDAIPFYASFFLIFSSSQFGEAWQQGPTPPQPPDPGIRLVTESESSRLILSTSGDIPTNFTLPIIFEFLGITKTFDLKLFAHSEALVYQCEEGEDGELNCGYSSVAIDNDLSLFTGAPTLRFEVTEYWPYDPNDGDGPIYDSSTGARLRVF
jgi:hypothetical protein